MSLTRRNILVGTVGLACSGVAVAAAQQSEVTPLPEDALDRLVPQRFGNWTAVPAGHVVVPPQSELSDEIYNDVLVRVYEGPSGASVALLLAYGSLQSRDMQLHRPELCYPAAGFAIQSVNEVKLRLPGQPVIGARLLGTASQTRPEQVLYWTRIGNDFPTTQFGQRWAVVRHNLRGEVPDGILVRMSTVTENAQTALPVLRSFAAQMMKAAPARTRQMLVGSV